MRKCPTCSRICARMYHLVILHVFSIFTRTPRIYLVKVNCCGLKISAMELYTPLHFFTHILVSNHFSFFHPYGVYGITPRILSSTSNISNFTISGDKGDKGDRITTPTPAETLGWGSIVWRGHLSHLKISKSSICAPFDKMSLNWVVPRWHLVL